MVKEHKIAIQGLIEEKERLHTEHETAVLDLRKKNEDLHKQNEDLRLELETTTKSLRIEHETAIKVLRDEYEAAVEKARLLTKNDAAVIEELREQHRTEVERLQRQLAEDKQKRTTIAACPQTTKNLDSDKIETLQRQNKILSSTVFHYKQIITDTEQMLSRLHGHVEREESRWSAHAEDLQKQLDEALSQLNTRNLQSRSRQKSQNSANEEGDSEDESEVMAAAVK